MITTKCVLKFRDKNNKIYGYRLIDLNGQTQDVTAENLKNAISNGDIHVINLKLTRDGRLMDTCEKQLKSKVLGEKPKPVNNNKVASKQPDIKISDLAKAFAYIDCCTIDMGDNLEDFAEEACIQAGINIDVWVLNSEDKVMKVLEGAYQELIDNKISYLRHHAQCLLNEEHYITMIKDAMAIENVDKIKDSKTYRSIYLIYKYFSIEDKKISRQIKVKILDELRINGINSIKVGYNVGNEYFAYLDKNIFGTISNCSYTVGHILTTDEKKIFKELKPYSYMCNKDFNILSPRPEIGLSFLFKNGNPGEVIVDVKVCRKGFIGKSTVSTVGYIKDLESFTLNINNKDNAKIVAEHCNRLGKELIMIAHNNERLLHLLPLGEKVEKL